MAIHDFVQQAIDAALNNNYEYALLPICSAIDATAKLEYPSILKVGVRYKKFLRSNSIVIGCAGFKVLVHGNIIIHFVHPDIKTEIAGITKLEDIIYHVMRSGIIHDASIKDFIDFSSDIIFRYASNNKKIILHKDIVWGLILTVILSPANKAIFTLNDDPEYTFYGIPYKLNMLWGEKDGFIQGLITSGAGQPTCKDFSITNGYAGTISVA